MSGVVPIFQGQLTQSFTTLRGMGFDDSLSHQALFFSNFNLNNAVRYLLRQAAGDENPVAGARLQTTTLMSPPAERVLAGTPATLRAPPHQPGAGFPYIRSNRHLSANFGTLVTAVFVQNSSPSLPPTFSLSYSIPVSQTPSLILSLRPIPHPSPGLSPLSLSQLSLSCIQCLYVCACVIF